jgi:hypothetical protein
VSTLVWGTKQAYGESKDLTTLIDRPPGGGEQRNAVYIDDGSPEEPGELNFDVDGHVEDSVGGGDLPGLPLHGDHWFDQAPDLSVDTADGDVHIGAATVDTDGDGRNDTAVVHDQQGDTVLYTDTDGDGHADVATELRPDGSVVIADHTAEGWTRTQSGHLTADGQYQVDSDTPAPFTPPVGADAAEDAQWAGWSGSFSDAGSAAGVVRIDNTTGQWISQN